MGYDPLIHHRRSIRIPEYNYFQPGAYFFTTVTKSLFGEIKGGVKEINQFGKIVLGVWKNLPVHYSGIEWGTFCLMPDHVQMKNVHHNELKLFPACMKMCI